MRPVACRKMAIKKTTLKFTNRTFKKFIISYRQIVQQNNGSYSIVYTGGQIKAHSHCLFVVCTSIEHNLLTFVHDKLNRDDRGRSLYKEQLIRMKYIKIVSNTYT